MKPDLRSLILLSLLLPLSGLGQSYEWFNRNEHTPLVSQDQVAASEQDVYAVGSTCANARCDGYLVKYRAEDGRLQWQRQVSVDRSTTANAVDVTEAGIFVGGATGRGSNPNYFVRLYSHDGDVLWTRNFEPQGLRSTIVAAGDSAYLGTSGPDYRCVVRRISTDGRVLWTHSFPPWTGCAGATPGDGELYVTVYNEVNVLRAEDGQWLRSFPTDNQLYALVYHAGFLYLRDYTALTKYSPDGDEIWHLPLDRLGDNGPYLSSELEILALSDDGLLVPAEYTWPIENEGQYGRRPLLFGRTLIKVGFDGTIAEVTEFLGHEARLRSLTVQDGAVYASGYGGDFSGSYVARYSTKPLLPPSLVSLAGATPAMPPRLAMLYHDYGAGPVRVGVRDAAPGSLQYRFRFSDGLTPVSFGKAADLNGNGYEELVVVSRLPAVAEIRDSLDGSLVSTIEFGAHLEPLVATVENRVGTPPRLAVAVRNRNNDSLLLRIFNLENGALIASNPYHPGFDPVDVSALPDPAGSESRRYALLARNRVAGDPNKIELRSGDGELLGNYWLGSEQDPVQLAVSGGGMDGLAVLRYAAASSDLDVLRIDVAAGDRQRVRFSPFLAPVAMLELPDTNGNGYPQYTVFGEETGRKPIRSSVKAKTRDLATQALDHYVYTGREYRPQDAVYVGAVPGFSDSAFALLGYRPGWYFRTAPDNVFRVTLTDAGGTKLFDLRYSFD